ncbi:AAA family ATPase [Pseudoflavitalea rhizosphaerae]|uniref:AAA family ATPase n=1 Tax=Pseudoflavitalea rhizosphaerae TaxID=1884793 RepID=UPI0013DFC2AE|nr:AAA family ATPase [Pseudoflavitalea rhizosphaerae]
MTKEAGNLEVKNFKSIRDVRISTSRINVFFGKPNSGKSNLLEALTLFNVIQSKTQQQSQASVIRYNTLDNLFYDRDVSNDISIDYNGNIAYLSYYAAVNTYIQLVNPSAAFWKRKKYFFENGDSISNIDSKEPILPKYEEHPGFNSFYALLNQEGNCSSKASMAVDLDNPIRKYEYKEGMSYSDPFRAYLKPSGENLFTIVQGNPKIKEFITTFFDEFNLEFLLDFSSKKFEVQKKEKGIVYKIPFELTPDTLRRMLFYISAIYSNKNATILLEEPESHSFPPYIKELSELIKEDSSNRYFITTHSPYFINSLIEDSLNLKDIAFFHVYYENYQTKIKRLDQSDLDILWNSGADVFFNIDALNK